MEKKEKKKLNMKVQWAKFVAVLVCYLVFLYWVKSWWGLLVIPFIYDVYITKKIKWQWWKDSEGPVKWVMSWVDALVFALVAVYFINLFFFQNYVIPSSSLEKSLLTGDYLFVSKMSYGPRIPETPLTMPLTQHTLPVFNSKATAGFALADVVTIESGIQHFAHSVYTYEGSSALPMLNDVPVVWDELRVLDGYPMQFNVTARRNGQNWYIGASTIQARKVDIHLSDLIGAGTYNAYIFADNKDGTDLVVTELHGLTAADTISRDLLANGGCVIKLTPGVMKLTTPYSNYRSYEAEHAKLSGRASVTDGKDGRYSSGGAYVGYVGGGADNAVTFDNVTADTAGKYTLRIYYISGEPRSLKVDVNGKFAAKLDGCYANRGDWTGIRAVDVEVELAAGKNTVRLYNDQAYGPSIDRIALAIPETLVEGDLNYDGTFDVLDLVLLTKYIHGMASFDATQYKIADFLADGTVDALDLGACKRRLLS